MRAIWVGLTLWVGAGCSLEGCARLGDASTSLCPARVDANPGDAVDRMREAILTSLQLRPGLVVGDIGTGGGWFTTRIAKAVGKTGKVYGTDLDAKTLEDLRQAPSLGDDAATMRFTLVPGERETGLDDLPDNSLDLILMIDSLCFDQRQPNATNVAYLRKFLRLLKPGGRLVHHMDCTCETTVEQTESLFASAGFVMPKRRTQLTCAELSPQACPTAEAQTRTRFVGTFLKAP